MGNTSATGGTLSPVPPMPLDDLDLDEVFQALIASITGLDGSLVRPRWQVSLPKQPASNVNWCALGVTNAVPDAGAYIDFDQIALTGIYYRHEEIDVLTTFYGPQAKQYTALLRDGLAMPQNCEVLLPYMIRFVETGAIRTAPEFVNQQWIHRMDMSMRFRRKVSRTYAVTSLLIADVHLIDDTTINDTIIVPPGSVVEP